MVRGKVGAANNLNFYQTLNPFQRHSSSYYPVTKIEKDTEYINTYNKMYSILILIDFPNSLYIYVEIKKKKKGRNSNIILRHIAS